MFDHPDNPQHLMQSLFAIVGELFGRRRWYGIAEDKLSAVQLPTSLRLLYGELGNMPGSGDSPFPFSTQDHLVPFELLRVYDSRLWFAAENQGCWQAYTELTGDDPRVWFVADKSDPVLEHPSLTNFLVTLCLQELTMGCPYLYAGEDLPQQLEACGHRVTPLWTKGLFPAFDCFSNPRFYLVDGGALLYDEGWIGFRTDDECERFADALVNAKRIHPRETLSALEYLSSPDLDPFGERIICERLARDLRKQADELQAKAAAYERAANNARRRSDDS